MYVRLQVGQRFILSRELFQPNLDTVSTTCGSGWVRSHADAKPLAHPPATAGGTDRIQAAITFAVKTVGKIIGKVPRAQALIGFPQRPQNFVPAG